MSFIDFEHDGKRTRLAVVRTAGGVWVGWPGGAKLFAPERSAGTAAGPAREEVRAPMTGRIVRIAVAQGDPVAEDDLLVILEAMKMEYRLTAPRAGTVEAIRCREGDLVDLGATLVRLKAPEPAADPVLKTVAAPAAG
jgi:acetyl/propionyl-CoA carboxylase alpha subunit